MTSEPMREIDTRAASQALVERVVSSTIGLFDLAGIYLGQRLGLYRALHDGGPANSTELAERAGIDERYTREWLEHQAVTGLLEAADAAAGARERRYALPGEYAAPLVDADSASFIAPLARQALGMLSPVQRAPAAFRSGEGMPYRDYGEDTQDGIAELNRAMLRQRAGQRLDPGDRGYSRPPRRRTSGMRRRIGWGEGWSSIAIARAYP